MFEHKQKWSEKLRALAQKFWNLLPHERRIIVIRANELEKLIDAALEEGREEGRQEVLDDPSNYDLIDPDNPPEPRCNEGYD